MKGLRTTDQPDKHHSRESDHEKQEKRSLSHLMMLLEGQGSRRHHHKTVDLTSGLQIPCMPCMVF